MKPKWKNTKKFKPEYLLEKLNKASTVGEDGRVSFQGFYVIEIAPTLYSMIEFPDNSCFNLNQAYLERAIFGLAAKGDITPDNLIEGIREHFVQENKKKEETYYLLTHIAIDSSLVPDTLQIKKSKISFFPAGYSKNFTGRNEAYIKVRRLGNVIPNTPDYYLPVIVEVKSKNESVAVEQCLSDLDLQRAIWSLFSNGSLEIGGANWKPINKIRLGSYHTLHKESGEITNVDMVWYDPNFTPAKTYSIGNNEAKKVFFENADWVTEQLERCSYSTQIEDSLIRYVRALDEADANVSFLKLWGAMESLVSLGELNNEKLPKRCAVIFKERGYHQQILEHLREYRNQNIHSGFQSQKAKTYCYQLQLYFKEMVAFHLSNASDFDSIEEANSFLDLPSDMAVLEKRQKLLEKAIECRNKDNENE